MSATVSFGAVTRMLRDCAPGSEYRLATYSYVVKYNGRVFPSLPKHDNLDIGYVRKLVRNLQIGPECANKHFPGLIKIAVPPPESK
jgi:hypothetical protein